MKKILDAIREWLEQISPAPKAVPVRVPVRKH